MENLSAACRKAEPCGSLPPVSNHAQDAVSPPRFRTMCRIPAAPRGSEPCAGCRQPAHGFLPARFHTCLSAHRFCPHFSACTLLSVLSYLYFYNYIFLFVFSYLRFSACTFPLALFHSFFSVHAFPSVLPAQKQNANPKTKHPAQRQNANPKIERQTRRNTGMVSRGAGQTIVVPPS